jgi:PAS domain S-box-containing protein
METTLQNIESQLKNVVEHSPFPIGVYTGRDMKVVLANKALINTWGKGTEIIGRSYFDVLPELAGFGIYEKLLEVLDTGQAYEAKNSRVDLVINGMPTVHYFNYTFTPLHDGNGNVYGVMNTAADVTDLMLARQHILETEEKLRLAVHSAAFGTYEINLFNDEVKISGNFRKMWDIHDEHITKDIIVSRLHPEDLHIREAALSAGDPEGRISYEIRIIHRDRTIHWLRINGTIIKNADGVAMVLVGIAQDITAQKESEVYLSTMVEQRTSELQRSNDDLLQFSHIVSHDLKEPVRKVKIFSSMLREATEKKQRDAYLGKIDFAADRMITLIESILTYSETNASGFPIEYTDLDSIMQGVKKDLELLIDEKKAIFIEERLPVIQGSPILLQRLFYNLVGNALKFSKADEPPRVTISSVHIVKEGNDFIRISIEDNGIGIGPDFTDKIFNAFERLHSKDHYEGTGLGLALCRKIVERHNGTIRAVGRQEGAEFEVDLPLEHSERKFL